MDRTADDQQAMEQSLPRRPVSGRGAPPRPYGETPHPAQDRAQAPEAPQASGAGQVDDDRYEPGRAQAGQPQREPARHQSGESTRPAATRTSAPRHTAATVAGQPGSPADQPVVIEGSIVPEAAASDNGGAYLGEAFPLRGPAGPSRGTAPATSGSAAPDPAARDAQPESLADLTRRLLDVVGEGAAASRPAPAAEPTATGQGTTGSAATEPMGAGRSRTEPAAAGAAAEPATAGSAGGEPADAGLGAGPRPAVDVSAPVEGFQPANGVEENLLDAARQRRTDRFLSTLLLAKVLVPGWSDNRVPDADDWAVEELGGSAHLVAYTSSELMAGRLGEHTTGGWARFTTLINVWPGDHVSFAVNPDTPVGATLPGNEVVALASWAAKMGLTEEGDPEPVPDQAGTEREPEEPVDEPLVMQKSISKSQVALYLERGYDRVCGFVHRANEVDHLCTPEQIYTTLGLDFAGSSFRADADEVYLLRWRAHCNDLYRIPYGGQSESAMRAMQGWVVERAPFRGNGFAPCDTGDVIAEFKVDSVRLPHGAQLWRLDRDGNERLIALLDADGPRWRLVGA